MNAQTLRRVETARPSAGPCPVIRTERLVLRPHRLGDADAIAESFADFRVTRMLSRVPVPYHRQDALDWLVPQMSGMLPDWSLAITTGDDVHIGVVAPVLGPRLRERGKGSGHRTVLPPHARYRAAFGRLCGQSGLAAYPEQAGVPADGMQRRVLPRPQRHGAAYRNGADRGKLRAAATPLKRIAIFQIRSHALALCCRMSRKTAAQFCATCFGIGRAALSRRGRPGKPHSSSSQSGK